MSEETKALLGEYREIYKKFMNHTDADMPDDEALIRILLRADMEEMKDIMKKIGIQIEK